MSYHTSRSRPPEFYHATGLTKAQVAELCARIEAIGVKPGIGQWPPIFGLSGALSVTFTSWRLSWISDPVPGSHHDMHTDYRRPIQRLSRKPSPPLFAWSSTELPEIILYVPIRLKSMTGDSGRRLLQRPGRACIECIDLVTARLRRPLQGNPRSRWHVLTEGGRTAAGAR